MFFLPNNKESIIFIVIYFLFFLIIITVIFFIIKTIIKIIKNIFKIKNEQKQNVENINPEETKTLDFTKPDEQFKNKKQPLLDYKMSSSVIQQDSMKILKDSEIKIPTAKKNQGSKDVGINTTVIQRDRMKILEEVLEKLKINIFSKKNQENKNVGVKTTKSQDNLIFGNKSEISRSELRLKLRKDPKVYQAQKKVGLNLDASQRVKLEKEISKVYGLNISKSDFKRSIGKLSKKMTATKDLPQKRQLRKEIKFFKKIGKI